MIQKMSSRKISVPNVGDTRIIEDLSEQNGYIMSQVDYEINDILKYIGRRNKGYTFIFVKYDNSGADFKEVWASTSGVPYLSASVECLFVKT